MPSSLSKLAIFALDTCRERIEREISQGFTLKQIAARLRASGCPVEYWQLISYKRLRGLNGGQRMGRSLAGLGKFHEIIKMYSSRGISLSSMAKVLYRVYGFDVGTAPLYRFAKKHGMKFASDHSHRRTRLDEEEKHTALRLRNEGFSHTAIACRLDCSHATVAQAIAWARGHRRPPRDYSKHSYIGSSLA